MPERPGPRIYTIAAHRGFADALVAGLIPRYADPNLGLARLTVLLPSQRTARTLTEAFVRASGGGMLLPRMAVVGDLDLDETLGSLFDPVMAGAGIPPGADPTRRWLRLAELLRDVDGDAVGGAPTRLRRAFEIGRVIDRLLVEGIGFEDIQMDRVAGIVGNHAAHWIDSTRTFMQVLARWRFELAERGEIDAAERRNRLFDHAARLWRQTPPDTPIVAAGVTSASPSLARLLRVVSELPRGAVILPDLDLALDGHVWDALGNAGTGKVGSVEDSPFGPADAVTHPQYHLKLLLNRMGIAREEVRPWHRAGMAAAAPARSRAISNLFLPPEASAIWVDLPADQRRLSGVRLMHCAHPGEEAQAVAILVREALEEPERRVAVITPDRGLAARIVANLRRWGIEADDTAGRPLPQTPAGRLVLLLADVLAQEAAPVPLVALLGHPLVRAGEGRAAWLEQVRALDLALRGPRLAGGLGPLRQLAARKGFAEWWQSVETALIPLMECGETPDLGSALDLLVATAETLCGESLWSQPDGRSLSALIDDLRAAAADVPVVVPSANLPRVLRDALDRVAVRPPWGGHPRVAIYGLLEARMSRSELVICCGMTEGVWPASPAQDPLLPPPLLRALGVPGADFRIGLAAHDLAAALGAPEVVLSWSDRDEAGPVMPSRFVLRLQALLGELGESHREARAVALARRIDDAPRAPDYPQPRPCPNARQRLVDVAVTALDRLRGDPYQFYASAILRLRRLEPLDAVPSPAWKGTAVHAIMHRWHNAGEPVGGLLPIAEAELDTMSAHPLMRSLWRPRLMAALEWIDAEIVAQTAEGRRVIASEIPGEMTVRGVRIHGRADRIDRLPDGRLAIVDYKTGAPPSNTQVQNGFALQLGLIGLIAEAGGFDGIAGSAERFEYWSMARNRESGDRPAFGYVHEPILDGRKRSGLSREDFLPATHDFLDEALARWIVGDEPFTARPNPDLPVYTDYDQLMRLDEWITRQASASGSGA